MRQAALESLSCLDSRMVSAGTLRLCLGLYPQACRREQEAPRAGAVRRGRPKAGPSKTPRAQHPLALVGKLLQQLKKDTLQNICEDLKEPVSGNKEELIMRIADAM